MTTQTQHSKKSSAQKQAVAKKASAKQPKIQAALEEERHGLIAETAYLIAERRGFQGNMALDDWLQAEAEVNARGAARH